MGRAIYTGRGQTYYNIAICHWFLPVTLSKDRLVSERPVGLAIGRKNARLVD